MSDQIVESADERASGRVSGWMEIVGRLSGRRRWTVEQKLAILRDAFGPKGSVQAAIERHEVGSGAIYTWRRQAMSGALTGVTVPSSPALPRFRSPSRQRPCRHQLSPSLASVGSGSSCRPASD